MRVWTIQTPAIGKALASGNVWRTTQAPSESGWIPAYRWMTQAMRQRLGPPESQRQFPVWVWCQWRGTTHPVPDLRFRGHLPPGTAGVRIELEIDEARLLRSDFELWHYVLNGWYLPASLADERDFDARTDRRRIEPSWQRIFDLDWRNRRYTAAPAAKSIQGVVWELRPGDICSATPFIAR